MNDGDTYNTIFDKAIQSESYASTETIPTERKMHSFAKQLAECNMVSFVKQFDECIGQIRPMEKNHNKKSVTEHDARRTHTAHQII